MMVLYVCFCFPCHNTPVAYSSHRESLPKKIVSKPLKTNEIRCFVKQIEIKSSMFSVPCIVYICANNFGPDENVPSMDHCTLEAKYSNPSFVAMMMIRSSGSSWCDAESYSMKLLPVVVSMSPISNGASSAIVFGADEWFA